MVDLASLLKEKKYIIKPLAIIAVILLFDLVIVLRAQMVFLGRSITKVNKLSQDIKSVKNGTLSQGGLLSRGRVLKADAFSEEKKIVLEQEIPLFLSEVARLAKDANVELMQLTPGKFTKEDAKDSEGKVYFYLPIDLDLISGYHPLAVFINKLETQKRHVKVLKFNTASVNEAPFKYPVKMSIEILVVR